MLTEVNHWLEQLSCNGVELNLQQMLYYRSKTALMNLTPRKTVQAKMAGSYLAKTKGRGMEFDEARHYQPGDDIRAIDWRVTARSGKTHTKLYREEKERPVFVVVDLSRDMHFGTQFVYKSVQACHLASLIAWAAKDRGDRIGGLVFNQHQHKEFKPLTRQKAVLSFIHGMMELHQPQQTKAGEFGLADACARLRRLAHPGSLVLVISDFNGLNESAKQHLSRISRHCEVIAYQITDPFEHALPHVDLPQQVSITDGNASQVLTLGERKTEHLYALQHQAQQTAIQKLLLQCKAHWVPITASLPIEQQLIRARRGAQ